MASNNDSEHTVYACASSVREEFYNLCLLEAQDGESWAEDQRARFQIWGANLGVFASGHASSDYRLRGNNSIVEVLSQLLKALEANIVYLVKLRRETHFNHPNSGDSDEDELRDECSSSNSSSLTLPSLSSTEECGDHGVTPTSKARINVEAGITRLNTVARSIRRSGARYRNTKAEDFIDRDGEGNDLTAFYAHLATHIIQQKFPEAQPAIRQRIAQSISQRRNRIAYQRNHQRKLARERPLEPALLTSEQKASLAGPSRPSVLKLSHAQNRTVTSATSATKTQVEHIQIPDFPSRESARGSTVISGASFKATALDIPHPPHVNKEEAEFECPYCCQIRSAKDASVERWRRHVMKDLMPYICVFEECLESREVFRTYDDWIIHMQKEHPVTQWLCCAPIHGPKSFNDEGAYKDHMRIVHPGSFAPSDLSELTRMSLRPSFQIFEICPFCDFLPDGVNSQGLKLFSDESQHALQKHVASHLEQLSLISIHLIDNNEEVDTTESSSVKRKQDLHEPLPESYVDVQWNGMLPRLDTLSDDPAWTQRYRKSVINQVPSVEEEWPFYWESKRIPHESQENDKSLQFFIARLRGSTADSRFHDTLRDKLFKSRIEWPVGENRYFIPNDKLQQLLNPDSILMELKRCKLVFADDDIQRDVANNISRSAPRLFAILVCLKSGHLILKFLEEEIDDTHLPFERTDKRGNWINFKLCSKNHPKHPIKCIENWDPDDIINFYRDQWFVLAPVFDRGEEVLHQELDDNCILPFLEDNEHNGKVREDGFSSVWEIVIHPAHQKLYHRTNPENTLTSLALGRLHSTNEEDFKLGVEMLKAFSRSRRPHLVRLLATYRHKGRYFLLFPWAKSNLRKYWEDTPRPDFSEATVLWSLRQCKAIASGLHMIHEYRSTQGSIKARSLQPPPASSGDPAVEDDDRLYGRHGDIKPENILWSVEEVLDDSQCSNEGDLLIADFGLMDFRNRLTRSQVRPDRITGPPTYEPPELKLHMKISRAYDIWSLGCVYLEFITWLVGGWAELDRFAKAREVAGWNGISDEFFTIIEFRTQLRAIVREDVQAWMKDLHEKPRCSAFIHDFLNLVSEDMLVVNPKHRIHSGALNARLASMLAMAQADPRYLTRGRPTKRSQPDAQQRSP